MLLVTFKSHFLINAEVLAEFCFQMTFREERKTISHNERKQTAQQGSWEKLKVSILKSLHNSVPGVCSRFEGCCKYQKITWGKNQTAEMHMT